MHGAGKATQRGATYRWAEHWLCRFGCVGHDRMVHSPLRLPRQHRWVGLRHSGLLERQSHFGCRRHRPVLPRISPHPHQRRYRCLHGRNRSTSVHATAKGADTVKGIRVFLSPLTLAKVMLQNLATHDFRQVMTHGAEKCCPTDANVPEMQSKQHLDCPQLHPLRFPFAVHTAPR